MKKVISFTKMHGLGNCYIYVDINKEDLNGVDLTELAKAVSNPNTGIGSDGLILMGSSDLADVSMRIFNKDGSEAKNCGNGLRCVAKYAYENGIVQQPRFQIETLAGLVRAEVKLDKKSVTEVTVDMGIPELKRGDLPMRGDQEEKVISESIEVAGETAMITGVSMGNPHGIFFVDAVADAPVTKYGRILADNCNLFPEGLNVEFVEVINEKEMNFRVWERGSGITQACGTGACAAVVAAVLNGKVKKDEEVTVHLLGGDLNVRWSEQGNVLMSGLAETICEGDYFYKFQLPGQE
jgi:diaminopimelate epimerase